MRITSVHEFVFFMAIMSASPVFAFFPDSDERPEISVDVDEGKPVFIHKNKNVPCAGGVNHSVGCTRVFFYAELKGAETTPAGGIKKIRLQIGLRDVEVELSSDLKKKTCLFDAVLKHELTHLALHRRVLKRFAPEAAKAVLSTAENQSPPFHKQFDRISKVLKEYVDRMMKEDERQNALLDSADAYRYQQKQCENK